MDARRWLIVEAWLSLGLRIEWCPSWQDSKFGPEWIQDDDDSATRYVYAGDRLWLVEAPRRTYGTSIGKGVVPSLSYSTLRHELAHYLSATPEQRAEVNFGGLKQQEDDKREERATAAEDVLDAILSGASRIFELAMRRP